MDIGHKTNVCLIPKKLQDLSLFQTFKIQLMELIVKDKNFNATISDKNYGLLFIPWQMPGPRGIGVWCTI